MKSFLKDQKYTILALLVSLTIFILDLQTPVGSGIWILYTIPIVVSIQSERLEAIVFILGLSGILLLFGAILAPPGRPLLVRSEIRFFAFISVLVFAFVATRLIVTRKKLKAESQRLKNISGKLVQVNHELETFAYSVSHDLRSPIRTTEAFARIVLEDYAQNLDEEAIEYMNKIIGGTEKMNMIVDEMLTLFKVSKEKLNRKRVDLTAMARAIMNNLKKADPERDVKFRADDHLTAWVDEKLTELVLTNLVANAWKYTARQKSAIIAFGKTKYDGEDVYFVRDNGAGFDMDYADKLFEPFKRLHSEREFEGTGIGLATVKRIVEKHGGRIWGEGKVGEGAVFYFTLPES
ncbi:MAG: sensor histidine kinase [Chitinispirillaceae bacterium]